MSDRYEPYCLADATFYDVLSGPHAGGLDFGVAARARPEGWHCWESDQWLSYRPPRRGLPAQGWKIHVSARLDNADRVVETAWNYCVRRGIAFKFPRGTDVLRTRDAKHANRTSSGKFVTIYPADIDELGLVLEELGEALRGETGPDILSDLRWQDGPLYVRYGGFTERYCPSEHGERVPVIEAPDGTLVPDHPDAAFSPPNWVELPEVLAPVVEAGSGAAFTHLPYRITGVLHMANSGGLYRAEDTRDGSEVVLKEARPHTGLAADGSDAVTRLRGEREVLERLSGIEGVPVVGGYLTLGEHEYLVLDALDGIPLNRMYAQRHPLGNRRSTMNDLIEYTRWALNLHRELSGILDAIHDRGVVYGDLHLSKVMVRPDGRAVLVDFEAASLVSEGRGPANPGFAVPPDVTGVDIDRYMLACFGLALFLPMTEVIRIEGGKARQLTEAISNHFPVPRRFLDNALRSLATGCERGSRARPVRRRPVILGTYPGGWGQARASLGAGIITSATPDREDRLFPGDIEQFTPGGGLNVAHGAAGVIYALSATGCGRYPSFEEWLTLRARRPQPGTRPGFYDGLHGVAYVLDHLGHRQDALDLLDRCHRAEQHDLGTDLFGGLSGIGLNLLRFADSTGDERLFQEALRTAEVVADRLEPVEDGAEISGGQYPRAGLMRGSSGPALLFVRLYERTGDPALLDRAATFLRRDLRRCVRRHDGSMQVNDGWRTLPYLNGGSAGIGLVLAEYLAHRGDEDFDSAERAIRLSATCPFYVQSGLFNGRAGLLAYLSRRYPPGTAADQREVTAHIRRLNWHALSYQGHLAFPGDQMLRLSMDLATGSAGILLALGTAMHDEPIALPLLESGPAPARPPESTEFPAHEEDSD